MRKRWFFPRQPRTAAPPPTPDADAKLTLVITEVKAALQKFMVLGVRMAANGLIRLPVRGLAKVKAVAVLFALAHNLMRIAALAPELIGIGTGTSAAPAMVI